jgi:hypothetical protein
MVAIHVWHNLFRPGATGRLAITRRKEILRLLDQPPTDSPDREDLLTAVQSIVTPALARTAMAASLRLAAAAPHFSGTFRNLDAAGRAELHQRDPVVENPPAQPGWSSALTLDLLQNVSALDDAATSFLVAHEHARYVANNAGFNGYGDSGAQTSLVRRLAITLDVTDASRMNAGELRAVYRRLLHERLGAQGPELTRSDRFANAVAAGYECLAALKRGADDVQRDADGKTDNFLMQLQPYELDALNRDAARARGAVPDDLPVDSELATAISVADAAACALREQHLFPDVFTAIASPLGSEATLRASIAKLNRRGCRNVLIAANRRRALALRRTAPLGALREAALQAALGPRSVAAIERRQALGMLDTREPPPSDGRLLDDALPRRQGGGVAQSSDYFLNSNGMWQIRHTVTAEELADLKAFFFHDPKVVGRPALGRHIPGFHEGYAGAPAQKGLYQAYDFCGRPKIFDADAIMLELTTLHAQLFGSVAVGNLYLPTGAARNRHIEESGYDPTVFLSREEGMARLNLLQALARDAPQREIRRLQAAVDDVRLRQDLRLQHPTKKEHRHASKWKQAADSHGAQLEIGLSYKEALKIIQSFAKSNALRFAARADNNMTPRLSVTSHLPFSNAGDKGDGDNARAARLDAEAKKRERSRQRAKKKRSALATEKDALADGFALPKDLLALKEGSKERLARFEQWRTGKDKNGKTSRNRRTKKRRLD